MAVNFSHPSSLNPPLFGRPSYKCCESFRTNEPLLIRNQDDVVGSLTRRTTAVLHLFRTSGDGDALLGSVQRFRGHGRTVKYRGRCVGSVSLWSMLGLIDTQGMEPCRSKNEESPCGKQFTTWATFLSSLRDRWLAGTMRETGPFVCSWPTPSHHHWLVYGRSFCRSKTAQFFRLGENCC